MLPRLVVLFVFLACAGTTHAEMSALSKEFEAYVLAHHYVGVNLDRIDNINHQSIDVKINGQKVTLVVDTGCPRSFLTDACARRLHLAVQDTGITNRGLGGEVTGHAGIALIQSFTTAIGEINRTNTILVLPKGSHLAPFTDGIFGLDLLWLNAGIYPIDGTGLLLKPGPTPPVDITSYMSRLGFKAVAFSVERGRLMVDGHINGQPMRFQIDSGASFSVFDSVTVSAAVGHKLHFTPVSIEGIDAKHPDDYYFTPQQWDFGGFSLKPIALMATRTDTFALGHFNGLLGDDLLGSHRAIVDLGDRILWLK